jgi:hypothetical protein
MIEREALMSLEEAILDKVRQLPEAKQEEVLRFADSLQKRSATRVVPYRDLVAEMNWLDRNRAAYVNQWVAVEGDRLILADPDAQKVYDAAKAEGIESPFVMHIVPEDPLPFFAGWLDAEPEL